MSRHGRWVGCVVTMLAAGAVQAQVCSSAGVKEAIDAATQAQAELTATVQSARAACQGEGGRSAECASQRASVNARNASLRAAADRLYQARLADPSCATSTTQPPGVRPPPAAAAPPQSAPAPAPAPIQIDRSFADHFRAHLWNAMPSAIPDAAGTVATMSASEAQELSCPDLRLIASLISEEGALGRDYVDVLISQTAWLMRHDRFSAAQIEAARLGIPAVVDAGKRDQFDTYQAEFTRHQEKLTQLAREAAARGAPYERLARDRQCPASADASAASPRIRRAALRSRLFKEYASAFLSAWSSRTQVQVTTFPSPPIAGVPSIATLMPGPDASRAYASLCIVSADGDLLGLLAVDEIGLVRPATFTAKDYENVRGIPEITGVPAACKKMLGVEYLMLTASSATPSARAGSAAADALNRAQGALQAGIEERAGLRPAATLADRFIARLKQALAESKAEPTIVVFPDVSPWNGPQLVAVMPPSGGPDRPIGVCLQEAVDEESGRPAQAVVGTFHLLPTGELVDFVWDGPKRQGLKNGQAQDACAGFREAYGTFVSAGGTVVAAPKDVDLWLHPPDFSQMNGLGSSVIDAYVDVVDRHSGDAKAWHATPPALLRQHAHNMVVLAEARVLSARARVASLMWQARRNALIGATEAEREAAATWARQKAAGWKSDMDHPTHRELGAELRRDSVHNIPTKELVINLRVAMDRLGAELGAQASARQGTALLPAGH